jgi:hypothetical protein
LLCLNVEGEPPELFDRPDARPSAHVTGYLMPRRTIVIQDHCNGLILVENDVLNPATGRVVRLPKCSFVQDRYLAFDPAESPHYYQVLCIPMVLTNKAEPAAAYRAIAQCEWPPSPFVLSVFSSMTGRWDGSSQKGLYFASFDREMHISFWILHDSSSCGGHMEWILRRDIEVLMG